MLTHYNYAAEPILAEVNQSDDAVQEVIEPQESDSTEIKDSEKKSESSPKEELSESLDLEKVKTFATSVFYIATLVGTYVIFQDLKNKANNLDGSIKNVSKTSDNNFKNLKVTVNSLKFYILNLLKFNLLSSSPQFLVHVFEEIPFEEKLEIEKKFLYLQLLVKLKFFSNQGLLKLVDIDNAKTTFQPNELSDDSYMLKNYPSGSFFKISPIVLMIEEPFSMPTGKTRKGFTLRRFFLPVCFVKREVSSKDYPQEFNILGFYCNFDKPNESSESLSYFNSCFNNMKKMNKNEAYTIDLPAKNNNNSVKLIIEAGGLLEAKLTPTDLEVHDPYYDFFKLIDNGERYSAEFEEFVNLCEIGELARAIALGITHEENPTEFKLYSQAEGKKLMDKVLALIKELAPELEIFSSSLLDMRVSLKNFVAKHPLEQYLSTLP